MTTQPRVQRLPEIAVRSEPFVSLEHVNLAHVTWTPRHQAFWFEGLGAKPDPRAAAIVRSTGMESRDLHWANVGLQQFHLPVGEPGEPDQRLRGSIGLDYAREDLAALRRRLVSIGVEVAVEEDDEGGEGDDDDRQEHQRQHQHQQVRLRFRGPNGNRFVAHGRDAADQAYLGPLSIPRSQPALPGGKTIGLGMRYVDLLIPAGAAGAVAGFYVDLFGAAVDRPTPTSVRVGIGEKQSLRFTEVGPGEALPDYDGHHVAVYTNNFAQLYRRARAAGAIFENPRFPKLTYPTRADALKHNEFRVRDMRKLRSSSSSSSSGGGGGGSKNSTSSSSSSSSGMVVDEEVVFQLEHEIRSLAHPGFAATLAAVKAYRPGDIQVVEVRPE